MGTKLQKRKKKKEKKNGYYVYQILLKYRAYEVKYGKKIIPLKKTTMQFAFIAMFWTSSML